MNEHQQEASNEEISNFRRYPTITIRGLPFPEPYLQPAVIEELIDYRPCELDIFIVTYPKCGTTWTQYMVWEILNKGAVPPSPNQIMFKHCPFLEFTGVKVLEDLPIPRVAKTHLPFNLQPYSPQAKYIYIARNPWDCCASYYFHHKLDPGMPDLSFDEYFQQFINGELGWGDCCDHILSWFVHKNDSNILFMTFEDMKRNTKEALLRVAKFLGDSYYEDLQDEEILQNCLKYTDFKYLKQMGMYYPKFDERDLDTGEIQKCIEDMGEVDKDTYQEKNFKSVPFFRKGIIGDWKNHFSQEQIRIFNDYLNRKWSGTELLHFWPPVFEETSV